MGGGIKKTMGGGRKENLEARLSIASLGVEIKAFAMLTLQVYMLLFENRKFTVAAKIP